MIKKEYVQIPPNEIHEYWDLFGGLIEKARQKAGDDDHSLQGVYSRLVNNIWQLYAILEEGELSFIFVTCVIPYDLNSYLHSIYTSAMDGKKIDFSYYDECTMEIAKHFNCSRISGGGRKGWLRINKKYGYEEKPLVIKEVR